MPLSDRQKVLCRDNPHDVSHLKALFINTTPTSTAQGPSHTETLMRDCMEMMELCGVAGGLPAHGNQVSR